MPLHSAGTAASLLLLGLVLGMKHALEADHIAAVAALATRSRTLRHTVWQGVMWGTGHTLTLLFFGGVVLAMNAVVPQRLATVLEFLVGVMLVVLGLDVFRRLAKERVHFHVHRHADGIVHVHAHSHAHDPTPHDPQRHRHGHPEGFPVRALFVGMMHGMAGSAALVLLAASQAGSAALGLAQIAAFGAGSILGMAVLSTAIAFPLRWSAVHFARVNGTLQVLVGVSTIALGALLMHQTAAS